MSDDDDDGLLCILLFNLWDFPLIKWKKNKLKVKLRRVLFRNEPRKFGTLWWNQNYIDLKKFF